jgi:CIC family chloride channel protein
MVRSQPLAAGSGVQHVEAIMRGEAEPTSVLVVPIKFVGGWLAIGVGLALGREGPTIQMGATLGAELARRFQCAKEAMRDLQAALGGAGLAVAFNAPVGGALFVFEEVAHAFRLRLTMVTLLGTGTAIAVARMILGGAPDFEVASPAQEQPWELIVYGVFGGLMGVMGVFYNRTTLFFINVMDRLKRWPTELRAALVGAIVGVVGWFGPGLVGDGDLLSQQIFVGTVPLATLLLILVVRWCVGPLSYSAGTPGGLFSPLLLVGAALGALFVACFNAVVPADYALSVVAFAVVGMAAFFTGIVRAPLTGIILIAEMTATTSLMIPMVIAAFGAMLSASLMRGEPIYDTLRERMLATQRRP